MRYFAKISYDGTAYHGWQKQVGVPTIQSTLQEAFRLKASVTEMITGCGRTDAGVHAREYFIHFDTPVDFSDAELRKLLHDLNSFLPNDIAIHEIICVHPEANARLSAIARTYKYYISKVKDPFSVRYSLYLNNILDIGLMNRASEILFDYVDFTSFAKLHAYTLNNICTIMEAKWEEQDNMLVFTIKANRFLRNMVRAIVGTHVDVGRKRISVDKFRTVIEGKNRCLAGESVPARGLFLHRIDYPEGLLGPLISLAPPEL